MVCLDNNCRRTQIIACGLPCLDYSCRVNGDSASLNVIPSRLQFITARPSGPILEKSVAGIESWAFGFSSRTRLSAHVAISNHLFATGFIGVQHRQ